MTAIGIATRGPVIAEDVRDFQQWPGHAIGLCYWRRRAALSRPLAAAKKVLDHLKKNQKTLFTFLDYDDVPWNNNNAEHAIKAFAMLRHVIGGVTTEKGIHEYLILLSVCETCKLRTSIFLISCDLE